MYFLCTEFGIARTWYLVAGTFPCYVTDLSLTAMLFNF